jgi:CubicO group peptidase (beta-lactamase class C family)
VSTGSAFSAVWSLLDRQLESGRFPGYAVAIRHGDHTEIRTGGSTAVDGDDAMRADTIFRIASLSKIIGGALALRLVRSGAFRLDDPVAEWLPEMAAPRVLRHPTAELDDTVAAERAIVVRDLLTFTFGLGFVLEDCPISRAMNALNVAPGPGEAPKGPDELLARLASLPLARQPGERWLYHTAADVLGILIARATGRPLSESLVEQITGPLGMESTAFHARDLSRLAVSYQPGPSGLELDDPVDGEFAKPPAFESLGGGMVSTLDDYLTFLTAFSTDSAVIDDELIRTMTTDSLTDGQRLGVQQIMGPGVSWGMGVGLDIERVQPWMAPGRFWWNGGSGTTAFVDPSNDLTAVLLTQRLMQSATGDFDDFLRSVYSCLP